MNAKERVKKALPCDGVGCQGDIHTSQCSAYHRPVVMEAICAAQREAIEECAQAAIAYGRRVLAARVFSEQIAKKIRVLIEANKS